MKTWKPFFIWKGINSLNMGVEVLRLPALIRPKQRVEEIVVPGRNGALYITDGTFENVTKPVEIGLLGGAADRVFNWLKGSGEVIFGNEPDKKYEAFIINKISMEQIIRQIRKGQVQFDCQPFKYELNPASVEMTIPGTLTNKGTVESCPVLTVYGQGDVAVSINGRTFYLYGLSDYIVIDSNMQNAYRTRTELMNRHMAGEMPYFDVGDNVITWTGTVSKIEILPNWRWL